MISPTPSPQLRKFESGRPIDKRLKALGRP